MSLRRPICRALLAFLMYVGVAPAQEMVSQPVRRFGSTALRHGSRIQSLLFLPDEKLLVGGGNEPLRIWNLETGKIEESFADTWVEALAYDAFDREIVASGALRAIRLHRHAGGPEKRNEQRALAKSKIEAAPASVGALALAPDDGHLLAGCQNGQLFFVVFAVSGPGIAVEASQTKIDAHQAEVSAVAWTADGKFAYTASADRTIQEWKLDALTNLHKLVKARTLKTSTPVRALVLGPDKLIEAGDDGVLRMRELATGNVVFSFKGHHDIVQSLALHGTTLVSASVGGEIRIWDTDKRVLVRTLQLGFGDNDVLALSADGKLLAAGGDSGVVRVFDVDTGKERRPSDGPKAGLVRSVRTDNCLVAIGRDGAVATFNPASGQMLATWATRRTPRVHQDFTLAALTDGSVLVTGSSTEPELQLWDAKGKSLGSLPLQAGDSVLSTAFSASGKVLAIGCRSGLVRLVDWPERKVRQTAKASGPVTALAFSLESPVLAAVTGTHVELFDVPTGEELRKIASKEGAPVAALPRIADLAFSPDGRTLGLACYDSAVRLVDWTTGKHLAECEGHKSAVFAIAFAPDGRSFATASFDKTVRLWETFLGKTVTVCSGHVGPVTSVGFSADGRTVFSAGIDTTMAAWDATCSVDASVVAKESSDLDFQQAWQELASEDPVVGRKALWRLCAFPNSAERIGKTVYLVDPARVDQLFEDLNSEIFHVREKATLQLKLNGRWMEGRYEIALRNPPTLEAKRRMEWLVDLLRTKEAMTLKQERLRLHRVMTALEQQGNESARRTLEDLAKGAAEPELQKEAQQSLTRVRR